LPGHLDGSGGDDNFSGSGTELDPYIITTPEQLAQLATFVNAGTAPYAAAGIYYKLGNDINLGIAPYNTDPGWTPIGNSNTRQFRGVFDGNHKNITGLYINSTTLQYAGLFGYTETGSEIKDLGILDADITVTEDLGTNTYTGGIAGYNGGSLSNCYSTGSVKRFHGSYSTVYIYAGGIAGLNATGGSITNCYSTAVVNSSSSNVNNCYSGGIAGSNNGIVSYCVALNESILCVGYSIYYGRIAGRNETGGTLSNNIAFNNLLNPDGGITWDNIGAASIDGADITIEEINGDGTLGARFTSANGWAIEIGKLPGFGNAMDMPEHLK